MTTHHKNLIIRADADTRIGTGHVMRCIGLAQAWQDQGGNVTFLSHCESEALRQRILDEGFNLIPINKSHPHPDDLSSTLKSLSAMSYQLLATSLWLVLDGYHFTPEYQKAIRDAGIHLLVIDDMNHLPHYHADILLNQNIHAPDLYYQCDEDTILLLGTRYVLLRREFLKYRDFKRQIPDRAKQMLVTMGGADPDNVTLKVIEALNTLNTPGIEVKIVVGPSNPHLPKLRDAVRHAPCAMHCVENATHMPELMAWSDMAVTAAGSACWELAFMGLPVLIVVLAENQLPVAEKVDAKGVGINMGWNKTVKIDQIVLTLETAMNNKEMRAEMSLRGQNLIDSAGGKRVIKSIMFGELTLRSMQEEDCALIWKWANDPHVRAVSFSTQPILWEDHVRWFKLKLNDPQCFFFIAVEKNGVPVGQARCDKKKDETVISVSVQHRFRGKNYGSMIIKLASQEIFYISDNQVIHAYIKQGNEASKVAFIKAGFSYADIKTVCGQPADHFMLHRDDLS